MKRKPDHPPTISTVPHPPQQSHKREKPVQSRHPLQASTKINCTGPALHTAESHTENIGPGPPEKFSRTQHTKSKQSKGQLQRKFLASTWLNKSEEWEKPWRPSFKKAQRWLILVTRKAQKEALTQMQENWNLSSHRYLYQAPEFNNKNTPLDKR